MNELEDDSSQSEKVIHFGPGQRTEFLQWRRNNRDGYVLNEKQASVFIYCDTLDDITDEALAKPKHCSTKDDRKGIWWPSLDRVPRKLAAAKLALRGESDEGLNVPWNQFANAEFQMKLPDSTPDDG